MIENWLTWSFPGKSGLPSSISAKMQPVDQMSTGRQHVRSVFTTSNMLLTRNVILLPGQHDLGSAVVARRDVSGHLGVLDTGKAKVADLEVAVLVDENVGRFEVAVDDAGRVDVLEAAKNLVQEVLDELLLQWPRGEEAVQVSAEELRDKVDVLEGRDEDVGEGNDLCESAGSARMSASSSSQRLLARAQQHSRSRGAGA